MRVADVLRRLAALRSTSAGRGVESRGLIGVHIVDATGREQAFTVNSRTQLGSDDQTYKALKRTLSTVEYPQHVLALLLTEFVALKSSKGEIHE